MLVKGPSSEGVIRVGLQSGNHKLRKIKVCGYAGQCCPHRLTWCRKIQIEHLQLSRDNLAATCCYEEGFI